MAGTTRSRKPAAKPEEPQGPSVEATASTSDAATEAGTPAAEENTPAAETTPAVETVPATDSTPTAPDAAPLEPPAVHEPETAPEAAHYVSPTEVIPDDNNLAEVIVDDATKQPPADVDAVFVAVTPYGSTRLCTVRLVERTFLGPHQNPIHRLLLPAGAQVSESIAARILERLRQQAQQPSA
ncbi:hypothetical protein ACIBAC_00320 [Streptomyces sp. NPDC051362]|uniref:hypothetical protein n=1 Tax=Streptomyces sp. NPDC051362 TaxID=3365651 RepID=UPI00379B0A52